jgi:hypothetical protein
MFSNNIKSILFHNPDYHCTFFYRDELQKLGWKADIFVSDSYPRNLLYSEKDVISARKYTKNPKVNYLIWFLTNITKYKYIFYYGRPPNFSSTFKKLRINTEYDPFFIFLKLFNRKIIYLPSGCRDEFTKKAFSLFENGKICGNCGFFDRCDEESNIKNLSLVNKYADLVIGLGFTNSKLNQLRNIKWKSFDLSIFNSHIEIPGEFQLPKNGKFRILHSTSLQSRKYNDKNIKGSKYVIDAVAKLKSEGYNCELIITESVHTKNMRYIQAQADLIIDQLIYGHWGSSSLEGVALGKPVICYFNKEWKINYLRNFSIDVWPFIEADTDSIYGVIKNLLDDPSLILEYSKLSTEFATKYLNIESNAKEFVSYLESI